MDEVSSLKYYLNNHPNIANENQMRWWIFNRDSNGIETSGAIVKKQNRWFVNPPKMREWLLQGEQAA